jgi:hypothetical protein
MSMLDTHIEHAIITTGSFTDEDLVEFGEGSFQFAQQRGHAKPVVMVVIQGYFHMQHDSLHFRFHNPMGSVEEVADNCLRLRVHAHIQFIEEKKRDET